NGLEYDSAFLVSEKSHRYYTYEGLNKIIDPIHDGHDVWYTLFVNQNVPYDLDVDSDEVNQNNWTVFVNARVEDKSGNLLGVCGVGVQMTNIQKMFKEAEEEYNVKINLVDKNGLVQVDTDDINIENAWLDATVLENSNKDEYVYQTIDSDEFAVTKYVEYLDWYLVVRSEPTAISKRFINTIMINIVLFLMVMGFLIATIFVVIRRSRRERDEKQKLLIVSERAVAASEAKSSFLSQMSHEIRTPINVVLGMNEMILREGRDTGILTYAETIKHAGNTLLGIINDILDFSKIEAKKMEIIPAEYDLSEVINDLVAVTKTRSKGKELELKFEFDPDIPRFLYGDEVRIKQVIINILSNAVKYTEKGSVTFGIGFKKSENKTDSISLHVSVKDTGIGIKPGDLKKLFNEFERLDEKKTRNIEGTGLGMTITKNLLEMMGSQLVVESEYGKGSVFSFDLDQKVIKWEALGDYASTYHDRVASREHYKEKFTAEDAKVLVVDDTKTNLDVFCILLKNTKVKIDTAGSGEEALSAVGENKYDLIFLDHMMPEKDGIETLHDMREKRDNKNYDTPVVCLTANAISGAREKYISEGFVDYLTKPIDPDALEEMLIKYLPKDKVHISENGDGTDDKDNEDDSVMARLEKIKGIDVKEGLKYCVEAELYLEVIESYYSEIDVNAEQIELYYNENNIKDFTVKVHSLKSSSKSIGAVRLSEKAALLEKAGKDGNMDYIRENTSEVLRELRELKDSLSEILSKEV
ncbi:MAG: response regulator, partial [Lachnospiraceae bacterium]|nr:response regulator [Lachnospiraceae bacterium]